MRIPTPPAGYTTVRTHDLSWSEDGRTKAVAVECRDPAGQPLYLTYRLEPDWMLEQPAAPVHSHYTNFLGFYPWPDQATADLQNSPQLRNIQATPASVELDGQTYPSRRYLSSVVIVDLAFTDTASLIIGRPPHLPELPPITTNEYTSTRRPHSEDDNNNGEYRGFLDLSQGNVFPHQT